MTLKTCHKTPRSINTPLRRIDGKCHRNRRSAGSGLEEFCEALAAAGADAPHSLIVDGGDGAEPSVVQVITYIIQYWPSTFSEIFVRVPQASHCFLCSTAAAVSSQHPVELSQNNKQNFRNKLRPLTVHNAFGRPIASTYN